MITPSADLTNWLQWLDDHADDPELRAGCGRLAGHLNRAGDTP